MPRRSRALPPLPFRRFNSSPEVIRLVVMMYVRFPLSLRNVEDLLFERGIDVCHETVRMWWNRFGPLFAGDIRRQRVSRMRGFRQWRWHLDEMYVKLNGEMVYLWRAVDHEGEILESYITKTRDKDAALRFMKKALKRHGRPEAITTNGLRSYGAAMKELGNAEKQEVGRKQRTESVPPQPYRSWQISIPRSNSRSSAFRSDSGKRTYITTTSRITSGEELKYRNGEAGLQARGMPQLYLVYSLDAAGAFGLTEPAYVLILGKSASPHRSSPADELTYQWHDFRGAGQDVSKNARLGGSPTNGLQFGYARPETGTLVHASRA